MENDLSYGKKIPGSSGNPGICTLIQNRTRVMFCNENMSEQTLINELLIAFFLLFEHRICHPFDNGL